MHSIERRLLGRAIFRHGDGRFGFSLFALPQGCLAPSLGDFVGCICHTQVTR
jgi:hypothetical protein